MTRIVEQSYHLALLIFTHSSDCVHSNIVILFICDLPHLKDIVVGHRCNHKSFILVPSKVWHTISVSAVNEEEFWWTIHLLLLGLGQVEARHVPNHYSSVLAWGGQQVWLHLWEAHIVDVLSVGLQAEELRLDVPYVPYCYCWVGWSTADEVLVERGAVNTHDFLYVAFNAARWLLQATCVPYLHLFVVAHSDEDVFIEIVPGHIFYDGVVGLKVFKGILSELVLISWYYVPDANAEVVWSWEKNSSS